MAALVLLGALAGLCSCRNSALANLERTRRALRQEGFKLELAEFQFRVSPEESARAAALDEAVGRCFTSLARSGCLRTAEDIDWLPSVGTNAALILWNQPDVRTWGTNELWAGLRPLNHAMLDRVCQVALSGPYRRPPPRVRDGGLEYSPDRACWFVRPLAARALANLHDQNPGMAWTNVMALTRLVVQWRPQPFALIYLWFYAQREQNSRVAYRAIWQALQAGVWSDPQLGALQREWESADVRSGLSEIAACARAYVDLVFRHGLDAWPDFQPVRARLGATHGGVG